MDSLILLLIVAITVVTLILINFYIINKFFKDLDDLIENELNKLRKNK